MPKVVEVPGVGNVEFPDGMDDAAIGAALVKQTAPPSARQKLVGAVSRFVPSIPGQSDEDRQGAVGGAVGMGMGMTMPNPISVVKSLLPRSVGAAGEAADPVLEQIKRVNSASGTGDVTTNRLPTLPKVLDWVLPSKATKIYKLLRGATERSAAPSSTPYPTEPAYIPPPRQGSPPTSPSTAPLSPELQAGAEASRARVLSRIQPAAEAPAATSAPTPEPPAVVTAPPAATQEPTGAAQLLAAPQPERSAAQIFEIAGRSRKVSELAKAIDANASAHLGVDPLDPRFGEALSDLPPQWWEGMAQVAKINKPSAETVKQTIGFFKDRAAQAVKAGQ